MRVPPVSGSAISAVSYDSRADVSEDSGSEAVSEEASAEDSAAAEEEGCSEAPPASEDAVPPPEAVHAVREQASAAERRRAYNGFIGIIPFSCGVLRGGAGSTF